ncbi:MAG: class II fructose-bisphosphate aldolase [Verrucomicrobia bacterium]|nr:class II fructose-bisphosphate aldolase [Verrucomicrobiota bacterium]
MAIVNTVRMFEVAQREAFAIGAFNVNNMELLQGIIWAAKEQQAPIILQISRGAREYANMKYLRALIDVAVEEAPEVPIAIHLDHGDLKTCMTCIDEGYTSVMYDGSKLPLAENIATTKQVCDYAHSKKPYISVEAELGMLGGIEEDVVGVAEEDVMKFLTDPNEAEQFVRETKCDSLAVAIGTSHGAYKFKHTPKLAFDRIDEIAAKIPGTPLVMHGSSSVPAEFVAAINKYAVLDQTNAELCRTAGETNWEQMPKTMGVPEEAIARAAKMAVCKVNIDTDLRLALTASILKAWGESNDALWKWTEAGSKGKRPEFPFDPRKYLGPGREAVKAIVARKMQALGCAGKAKAVMG